jgi:hypothetical protein
VATGTNFQLVFGPGTWGFSSDANRDCDFDKEPGKVRLFFFNVGSKTKLKKQTRFKEYKGNQKMNIRNIFVFVLYLSERYQGANI